MTAVDCNCANKLCVYDSYFNYGDKANAMVSLVCFVSIFMGKVVFTIVELYTVTLENLYREIPIIILVI